MSLIVSIRYLPLSLRLIESILNLKRVLKSNELRQEKYAKLNVNALRKLVHDGSFISNLYLQLRLGIPSNIGLYLKGLP